MIAEHHHNNFETLKKAWANEDVGLLEVFDKVLDRVSVAICMFGEDEDGMITMTPVALMFEENPFERLLPPDPDGGFFDADNGTE